MSDRAGTLWRRLRFGGGARLLSAALALAASIPPLRRRIQARAETAARQAGTVLFVCHGNINRSAFAAALARREWGGVEVLEAGHDAVPGAPTGELGRAAAHAAGVELGDHAATPLSAEALRRADVVFAFDARNCLAIAGRGAAARRKLRLLGALAPSGPLEIADPHGGPAQSYELAFAEIAAAVGRRSPT